MALRRKVAVAVAATGLLAGAAYVNPEVADIASGIRRSGFAVYTFAVNSLDYKLSLRKYDKNSEEYYTVLSEVHLRSAKRILKLCETNRGFYTKAGQFIASLHQFPREYCNTLKVLQDQALFWPYRAIERVFRQEFGKTSREIFKEFNPTPLAAASLAQVHRALLPNGEEVAVKVQYPGLERQFQIDVATMGLLSRCVEWLFPEYRFEWLVPEFEKNLSRELDFLQEAKNAETTASNFAHKKKLRVPSIHWEYTTKRILTMEFMHGCKIDDVDALRNNGINPKEVARVLMEVFAEMIFCHGFVHGDPHPGNILIHKTSSKVGKRNFQLVLLDHGLYRVLDDDFRLNFCRLWKSMILLDSIGMQQAGEKLGAGEYHRYLPVILTGRSWNSKSGLGRGMSPEERARLKEEIRKFSMGDISLFMEGLSRDFLIVLRTDGLLRSIVNKLGAPPRLRLETYARFSVLGHAMYHRGKPGLHEQGIVSYTGALLGYTYLRLRLESLELYLRIEAFYTWLLNTIYRLLSRINKPMLSLSA